MKKKKAVRDDQRDAKITRVARGDLALKRSAAARPRGDLESLLCNK